MKTDNPPPPAPPLIMIAITDPVTLKAIEAQRGNMAAADYVRKLLRQVLEHSKAE